MNPNPTRSSSPAAGPMVVSAVLAAIGAVAFIGQIAVGNPVKAWQAYLVNLLLFSAVAHGALLFSTLMHGVRARWSGSLAALAESFSAFFPVAFVLYLLLIPGSHSLFTWLGHDLHGKETWLNLPFLFSRDLIGLAILYGLGFAYLYHGLWFRMHAGQPVGRLGQWLQRRWQARPPDGNRFRQRQTLFAFLYMLAFAVVLSLLGYDLIMSMDPHWYSTLFGAYSFIKAVYVGLGGLFILAALVQSRRYNHVSFQPAQLHDLGKLFFAFCLVWADFFYAQFVVIWYGNISEETAYVIQRTMTAPWNVLAWAVLAVCFIAPFLILINKKIKTRPAAMLVISAVVIVGMWFEHFLLLGPVYFPHADSLPLGWMDGVISIGFLGLMAASVMFYLKQFPMEPQPLFEEGR